MGVVLLASPVIMASTPVLLRRAPRTIQHFLHCGSSGFSKFPASFEFSLCCSEAARGASHSIWIC